MDLKPGTRLRSVMDATEVVVVKAPSGAVDLRCGGHEMVAIDAVIETPLDVVAGLDWGTQIGKRYANDDAGLELLCTKAGSGSLSVGDDVLTIKGAKPLPSSD